MKVLIAGSRDFNDYPRLARVLDELHKFNSFTQVISGGAYGADAMGERWAAANNIPVKIVKPDWKKYGKAAGPKRNTLMVDEADMVVAFWDQKSRGTEDTIKKCYSTDTPLFLNYFDVE